MYAFLLLRRTWGANVSFLLAILAGHLETIVLQFVFVGIYFFYRIIIKTQEKATTESLNEELGIVVA